LSQNKTNKSINEESNEIQISGESLDKAPSEIKQKLTGYNDSKVEQINETSLDELSELLKKEKERSAFFEDKFKRALADFQNLEKKTKSEIENKVNSFVDKFILDFLDIYDDFTRAKEAYSHYNVDTKGLDSILKNMNSLLRKYNISSIDALGEIFDPKLHEAISTIEDNTLQENTITKELRKGYISHKRVIRPTLVEISKKSNLDKKGE
jgi:molecular chaperone GrpE